MLRKKLLQVVTIFLLVAITATSCKKDLFNEKDAIAAQSDLLNLKYSKDADILKLKFSNDLLLKNIDVQIKNIDLQIQRVADSAQFAMLRLGTTLKFSADSSLEKIRQANNLAQILQAYQNQRMLVLQADSLARGTAVFNQELYKASQVFYENLSKARRLFDDSVTLATNNKAAAAAAIAESKRILRSMTKDYSISVIDNYNFTVPGAKISVYPYGSTTLLTVTADANGVARFNGIILDPSAYFSVSAPGYAGSLYRPIYSEADKSKIAITETIAGTQETYERDVFKSIFMVINTVKDASAVASAKSKMLELNNTILGSVKGNVDLTNGRDFENLSQMVTFTGTLIYTINGVSNSAVYTFATMSDPATGKYSIAVPDGDWKPSFSNTVEVDQKLYVKAWSDEDKTKSVPSIRTIAATLSINGSSSIDNGNGTGIYFTLPADSLTGKLVVLNNFINPYPVSSTANSINVFDGSAFYTYSNSYTSSNPRLDSLQSLSISSLGLTFLNNSSVSASNDNSVMWSKKKATDTLKLTLVSLVPGWINTAPNISAYLTNGKLDNFSTFRISIPAGASAPLKGSGGLFNNAAMYDVNYPTIELWKNNNGVTSGYLENLAQEVLTTNSTDLISLSGKKTVYLPIEYRNTISRARKPI